MVASLKEQAPEVAPILRLSTTGECNLNCFYCKPLAKSKDLISANKSLIQPSDATKLVKIAGDMGVRRVLISGGEPLLRKDAANFVKSAFAHRNIEDVRLVTNGTFLKAFGDALRKLGLKKVDINFNSLNFMKYQRITGSDSLYRVLDGVEKVEKLNFTEVRLNILLLDSINNDELINFARMTRDRKLHVRFIEYLPLVATKDPFSSRPILQVDSVKRMVDGYEQLKEVPNVNEDPLVPTYQFAHAAGKISFVNRAALEREHALARVVFHADGTLTHETLPGKSHNILQDLRKDAKDPRLHRVIEKILSVPESALPKPKSRTRSLATVSRAKRTSGSAYGAARSSL